MVRVIVNADDIGLSAGVTRGIASAMRDGIVTSTTLMASMPDAPEAARLARDDGLAMGVHLNITQGRPLLPPSEVPSLVDDQGVLWNAGELRSRLRDGRIAVADIEREFERQVERSLELGVRPTHVDSHHHVHASLLVARAMYAVARRQGIGAVRRVRSLEALDPPTVSRLEAEARARARRRARHGASARRPRMPLALLKPDELVADWVALFEDLARCSDDSVFEIICHPAVADAELRRRSQYVESRETELRVVTSPVLRRAVDDLGIRLVSFADL